MMKIKKYILFCLLVALSIGSFAQKASVRATIEPSDILIGEQSVLTLEVIAPKDRTIIFPVYPDTLIKGIEVLKMEKIDTLMTEVMVLKQRYIVTSFDSTLYHVPYMQVIDGLDTLCSNDIGLKVSAPQLSDSTLAYLEMLNKNEVDSIDFERLQLADIKDIQAPPFVWQDYLTYLLIPLGVLLFCILVGIIIYMVMNKRKKGYYFTPKVIPPPHVEALQALEQLKSQKLSQKGMEKEYFTRLTDILRHYVDRRFGVDAPEMTSDEIIETLQMQTETQSSVHGLDQILKVADLVKFAKYIPLPDENDLSLMNAFLFVNQTKIEEIAPVGKDASEKATENATNN